MKFPFWILALLIFISLVFAGYASYQLYKGKAIDQSSAHEVLSNAIDAVPSVKSSANIRATAPKSADNAAPIIEQKETEETKQPIDTKIEKLERNARKIVVQDDIDKKIEETKHILKKIGDIAVIAGEAKKIALVG